MAVTGVGVIGKKQLVLGYDQIIAGMASSDYANDGGLGVSSSTINPFQTPGFLRATAAYTDKSTGVADNIIAASEDSQATSGNNRIMVGTTGRVYSVGGTGTVTAQIGAGSDTYGFGITDIVPFKGNNYISSTTHVVQVNTSAWTRTEAWHSFADSSALHPLLVFEQQLWGGDGNNLVNYDGTTFNTAASWVLDASEKIVALGIDPSTGLMLVSVETSYNPTDSFQNRGIVYLYDGYSSKPRRKVWTDDVVTSFYNVGGIVYCGMGQTIGYWNGNGVTFLRKLKNVTLVTNDLPYKHHLTNIRNILLVQDGTQTLAYGEVVPGSKRWYPIAATATNTSPTCLTKLGNNLLGVASATNTFAVYDISSSAQGSGTIAFNNVYFPRPIKLHKIRVLTTGVDTNQTRSLTITITDENGNQPSASAQTNTSGATKYVFDQDYGGTILQALGVSILLTLYTAGIVRVIVYYDVEE